VINPVQGKCLPEKRRVPYGYLKVRWHDQSVGHVELAQVSLRNRSPRVILSIISTERLLDNILYPFADVLDWQENIIRADGDNGFSTAYNNLLKNIRVI
jgi:hypothetical protein